MEVSTISFSSPSTSPPSFSPSPPPQQQHHPRATAADLEAVGLRRLSDNLQRLLDPAFLNCADAEIALAPAKGGAAVAVHRCILAARSAFFLHHFTSLPAPAGAGGERPRLELADLVPGGRHIGHDALVPVLVYLYTGRLKSPPQEATVCMDDACGHGTCRPAIDFVVESMYAASGFQISELISLFQRRLSDFVSEALDEDVVPIIHVASTCDLQDLLNQCIQRVAVSTLDSRYLEKELPDDIYCKIKEIRRSMFHDESEVATPLLANNFHMTLIDLENRVAFARIFFPSEAKLVMLIAQADSTEEFAGITNFSKLKKVDLGETLPLQNRRLHERLYALRKTVELGRRYFPHCSDVLDKFLNEESTDLIFLETGTTEDQRVKRMRFSELKEDVRKAFTKDKAAVAAIASSASLCFSEGAADFTNAHATPSGLSIQTTSASTTSRQLKSQSICVAVDDDDVGVGSKRKLKSPVWGEFERVKTGDDCFAICNWCLQRLTAGSKNGTKHLHRHLKICQSRQAAKAQRP